MRINNEQISIGTDLTSNQTSEPIYLGHIVYYSIQLVYTGSPNGTFKLQASNDEGRSPSNWTDVTGQSYNITSAGSLLINVSDAGYRHVRLVWTDSASGVSTLTSYRVNVKGI